MRRAEGEGGGEEGGAHGVVASEPWRDGHGEGERGGKIPNDPGGGRGWGDRPRLIMMNREGMHRVLRPSEFWRAEPDLRRQRTLSKQSNLPAGWVEEDDLKREREEDRDPRRQSTQLSKRESVSRRIEAPGAESSPSLEPKADDAFMNSTGAGEEPDGMGLPVQQDESDGEHPPALLTSSPLESEDPLSNVRRNPGGGADAQSTSHLDSGGGEDAQSSAAADESATIYAKLYRRRSSSALGPQDESDFLREWNRKRKEELRLRPDKSKEEHQQVLEQAKKDINTFYAQRSAEMQAKKLSNREKERVFNAENSRARDPKIPVNLWEAVVSLIKLEINSPLDDSKTMGARKSSTTPPNQRSKSTSSPATPSKQNPLESPASLLLMSHSKSAGSPKAPTSTSKQGKSKRGGGKDMDNTDGEDEAEAKPYVKVKDVSRMREILIKLKNKPYNFM